MGEDIYVVIAPDEDSRTVSFMSRESLLKWINDSDVKQDNNFLSCIPKEHDPQYWDENDILVIKGYIVVPKVVEKITKRTVE